MEILAFLGFLGMAFYVFTVFRKRKRHQSNKNEIDAIVIQLITGNELINYSNDDKIQYFGSIFNAEEDYIAFKDSLPMNDKMLIQHFKHKEYDSSGDNLLVFRILKSATHHTFIVVVNDPSDMEQHFSIHEILGPFEN
jgi:hypothetical protein